MLKLSDQELTELHRECKHTWGTPYRAAGLLEVMDGITVSRPRWGRFQRRCRCGATQYGRGTEWGTRIQWEAV